MMKTKFFVGRLSYGESVTKYILTFFYI